MAHRSDGKCFAAKVVGQMRELRFGRVLREVMVDMKATLPLVLELAVSVCLKVRFHLRQVAGCY